MDRLAAAHVAIDKAVNTSGFLVFCLEGRFGGLKRVAELYPEFLREAEKAKDLFSGVTVEFAGVFPTPAHVGSFAFPSWHEAACEIIGTTLDAVEIAIEYSGSAKAACAAGSKLLPNWSIEELHAWLVKEFALARLTTAKESSCRSSPMDNTPVIVRTAGDLWKCLSEGRAPATECSAIRIGGRATNVAEPTFPLADDQRKWTVLDVALSRVEELGGDRATAMRTLIARVALQRGIERAEAVNMTLAEFAAAIGESQTLPVQTGNGTASNNVATAADDDQDELFDEICDSLRSPDHRCIVSKLWNRKWPTKWQDLAQECGTSPTDSAVKKALQRLDEKLARFADKGVCLENNEGTKRVKIVHP